MKTLYLDCGMGAAGDMLAAALLELLPSPEEFIEKLNLLEIPGVKYAKDEAVKCGISGTHMTVTVHDVEEGEEIPGHSHSYAEFSREKAHFHHHHTNMHKITHIVSALRLSEKVKTDVLEIYRLIAEAESHVHGVPVSEIHFHEVGTMDAVADITAVCMLMNALSPDEVIVSPVHVGSGSVKCAHGILPVPAPAAARILQGIPVYGGEIKGELCTPTGAALLKHFATGFGDMPVMRMQAVGYGMGKKDFERANCVRAVLGETKDKTDTVLQLSCNVDDMTAEEIGFAVERLFEGGAREVFTVPAGMKKSRPGTWICVLCKQEQKESILSLLFQYTTTLGIRETAARRYVLDRKVETLATPYGQVRRKVSSGYGVSRVKYEYEDLARIAKEEQCSIEEIKRRLQEHSCR